MSKLRFVVACLLGLIGLTLLLRLHKAAPGEERDFIAPRTWQLTGWRRLDQKRHPWELWGQDSPPFLYERVGEAVQWTREGQVSLFTPALAGCPPLQLTRLAAGPNNRLPRLLHWGEPERDPATGLPQHFTVRSATEKEPIGELTGHYNLPIPANRLTPPEWTGATLNMARPLRAVPDQQNTFAGQGITMHGQVLSQDSDGNLRVRLEFRTGQPSLPQKLPFALENLQVATFPRPSPIVLNETGKKGITFSSVGGMGKIVTQADILAKQLTDSDGGSYALKYLPSPPGSLAFDCQLLRLAPRAPGTALPQTVSFTIQADLVWLPEFRSYFSATELHTVHSPLTLTLPRSLPQEPLSPETKRAYAQDRQRYEATLQALRAALRPNTH